MKRGMKVLTGACALLVLVGMFYFISYSITKFTGMSIIDDDEFRDCLDVKNVKLFISGDVGVENINAVDYLGDVEVVNCDEYSKVCEVLDVKKFPSWIIGGEKIERDVTLEELGDLSGC